MRNLTIFIVFFCLLGWTPWPYAAQVYLWKDRDGTLHITDNRPPAEAQIHDVLEYTPQLPKDGGDIPAEKDQPAVEDPQMEQRCQVAARARRIADNARDIAAAARKRAEEKRKQAEDLKKRVGYDDDRLENFKYDIREREEAARQAEMFSEQAEIQAKEAELQAKMAESEAPENCSKRNLF